MKFSISQFSDKYDFFVEGVSYVGRPINNTAMFITNKVSHLLKNLTSVKECLVFAETGMNVPQEFQQKNCFVMAETPQSAYAAFVQQMEDENERLEKTRTYTLTDGGYYIGENVKIGANAYIEPLCLIGHDVKIGDNAHILTGAKIKHAVIGNDFIAGENCTIGAKSFTMTEDREGNRIRIPTLGSIWIGDCVEIGALSNVHRGSAGNTILQDNVKIDTLIHIAHDVHLEKNVELPAGVIVGGFTHFGANAYAGVNATIKNRIEIGEDAIIGMGAAVIRDVEKGAVVAGNPAKPLKKG